MRRKLRRARLWGSWGLLCFLGTMLLTARLGGQGTDVERRLNDLDAVHAPTRLTAIETRLDQIEFLGKAILVAVVGQLVLHGFNFRGRVGE